MARLIKKDTESVLVNEHDPRWHSGAERTDNKRWNLVHTERFPGMLLPTRDGFGRKLGYRRCEVAKVRKEQ
jgi:hypothetical protein